MHYWNYFTIQNYKVSVKFFENDSPLLTIVKAGTMGENQVLKSRIFKVTQVEL